MVAFVAANDDQSRASAFAVVSSVSPSDLRACGLPVAASASCRVRSGGRCRRSGIPAGEREVIAEDVHSVPKVEPVSGVALDT